MRSSHWMFCVTRPRFETRFGRRGGQQRLLCPALHGADVKEEQQQQESPRHHEARHPREVVVRLEDPHDQADETGGRQDSSQGVEGLSGSAATGSSIRRPRTTMSATIRAWKTKAARQLMAVVMRPPRSGRRRLRSPHAADHAERPRPGRDVVEEHRRQDVHRGSAGPYRCPRGSSCRGSAARDRATPHSAGRRSRTGRGPIVKHLLRPHLVGQLAGRDHEAAITSRKIVMAV